ncbi:MAG: hypothetical protein CVV13_11740 [Gammaproteobacteria bacterium HGW-Gammaproteobacteria-3]|nr:MAG: hypothetical protein CVV13_11740 [Gammaproteobacteria bacterium HGW-Gammaproteobacteria-3]
MRFTRIPIKSIPYSFKSNRLLDTDDLLVLDRGYPARWLIAYLAQHDIRFCMRVDETGFAAVKTFLRSGLSEQIITVGFLKPIDCQDYGCGPLPTTARLIRVVTPNGRCHVLMTSLLDSATSPVSDFAALYHSRWRIEEAFKHRMALENTSGLSWLTAQQDFGAKILADNLHALTVLEAEGLVDLNEHYKINRTYAFSHLKRCLSRWLLIMLPTTRQWLLTLAERARNTIRFKVGDAKPRPKTPNLIEITL